MTTAPFIEISQQQALNARLGEAEVALGSCSLVSMPRNLGLVVGNGCNIDCPHCYQLKNGDNLFRDPEIGVQLRRELATFYPYLETLRIQGGEVFALRGFKELVDEIAAYTDRPMISISTNGTLISEDWARRIVETPFQHITVSLDAGTAETYAKVRRGGDFEAVKRNIERITRLKRARGSGLPTIDSFFVVMRSNYREIPAFLRLLHDLGIHRATFQMMLVDDRNLAREPQLTDEVVEHEDDVRALHETLNRAVRDAKRWGQTLIWSGMRQLFEKHGLDHAFLREESASLTPGRSQDAPDIHDDGLAVPQHRLPPMPALPAGLTCGDADPKMCTNPWYTMFIAENGDVSLCFLSEPVGNLFETPLVEIWNSPAAIAKRSRMMAGRFTESGCSPLWCEWRDGKTPQTPDPAALTDLLGLFKALVAQMKARPAVAAAPEPDTKLRSVRRLLSQRQKRIEELEANLAKMWKDNGDLHDAGQRQIARLEHQIAGLRRDGPVQRTIRELRQAAGRLR